MDYESAPLKFVLVVVAVIVVGVPLARWQADSVCHRSGGEAKAFAATDVGQFYCSALARDPTPKPDPQVQKGREQCEVDCEPYKGAFTHAWYGDTCTCTQERAHALKDQEP